MALEPRTVGLDERNPQLDDMTRRFRVWLLFTIPILAFMVAELLPGQPLHHLLPAGALNWGELVLTVPVAMGRPSSNAAGRPSSAAT